MRVPAATRIAFAAWIALLSVETSSADERLGMDDRFKVIATQDSPGVIPVVSPSSATTALEAADDARPHTDDETVGLLADVIDNGSNADAVKQDEQSGSPVDTDASLPHDLSGANMSLEDLYDIQAEYDHHLSRDGTEYYLPSVAMGDILSSLIVYDYSETVTDLDLDLDIDLPVELVVANRQETEYLMTIIQDQVADLMSTVSGNDQNDIATATVRQPAEPTPYDDTPPPGSSFLHAENDAETRGSDMFASRDATVLSSVESADHPSISGQQPLRGGPSVHISESLHSHTSTISNETIRRDPEATAKEAVRILEILGITANHTLGDLRYAAMIEEIPVWVFPLVAGMALALMGMIAMSLGCFDVDHLRQMQSSAIAAKPGTLVVGQVKFVEDCPTIHSPRAINSRDIFLDRIQREALARHHITTVTGMPAAAVDANENLPRPTPTTAHDI